MAITGRLDETNLASLLQVLSHSRKSGRLSLARGGSRGVIVLRDGKLVFAGSSSVRETLGNILVCAKHITEQTLFQALERQHASPEPVRLGEVLVDMAALTPGTLKEVLEGQALEVVDELLKWPDGFFKFQSQSLSDEGPLSFDLGGFPVDEGLRVDRVLLRLVDQDPASDRPQQRVARATTRGEPIGLRDIAHYLNQPVLNAEMTMALLRYTSSRCDRALLFIRDAGGLRGVAQSGLTEDGDDLDARARDLQIDLSATSAFSEAVESREAVHGRLDSRPSHLELIEQLGAETPTDSIVVPMVVNNEVAFVLYADVLEGVIEEAEHLEILMLQAGLAMEKAMLEVRVGALESKLKKIPPGKQPDATVDLPASASLVAKLLSGESERRRG